MRIVDAEPQLISEILEEMNVTDTRNKAAFKLFIGHHQLLGRLVVVKGRDGAGAIVEMEQR